MNWHWQNNELVKWKGNARVGKRYPKGCSSQSRVCDPEATSFGDACGVSGCEKVSV